ncbi:transposase [Flectobacillus longus]|uniref:transposase n=1 Tax=Flectobacillus longus TaxID=2984207 RepID=UPI0024B6B350|nr:transposase [Flectobacillus longus]MDI9880078.1 transposase [Flectobacillus longus]
MSSQNTYQHGIRNSYMFLNEVYFWTATIVDWKRLLKQNDYKKIIIDCLRFLVEKEKVIIYGFVIMPNHVHILWELKNLNGKEKPHSSFLKYTAHQFLKDLETNHPKVLEVFEVNQKERKHQFWQRDPLAIEMYNRTIFQQKLEYIHSNPLQEKWSLANKPEDYYWSSALYYETGIDHFGLLTHYHDRF